MPPNRLYGFRTSTTFSFVDAWYRINFATGMALVAAGVLSGVVVVLLDHGVTALKPEPRYLVGIPLTGLLLLVFLLPVVLYSNRFLSEPSLSMRLQPPARRRRRGAGTVGAPSSGLANACSNASRN